MTFPVVEIFCPQCNEQMTLVNKPKLEDYLTGVGYDKLIDYHYQCKANERHEGKWHRWSMESSKEILYKGELNADGEPIIITPENCQEFSKCGKDDWCGISSEREILVMRFLIPKLDSGEKRGDDSHVNVLQTNAVKIESKKPDSKPEYLNPHLQCNGECYKCSDNIPPYDNAPNRCGRQPKEKPEAITIETLKEKAKLVREIYPEKDWQAKFMEIGSKAMLKNNYSGVVIYDIMKDLTEIFNPKNTGTAEEKLINILGESSLSFLNDCFNIMLNEN